MSRSLRLLVHSLLAPLLLFTSTLASAQVESLPLASPENVGLSPQRLQVLTRTYQQEVDQGRLPGAVIAIARKGQLAYFEAIGYRDAAAREPMKRDALFSIASMTKPMVSVAIMMLHEEGRLLLSDPVGKHLPALARMQMGVLKPGTPEGFERVAPPRQPTIQDLLRHTSGVASASRGDSPMHKLWPASSSAAAFSFTGPELIAEMARLPLAYAPGTVWDYSLSTDVLGLIVEALSGKSLGAYLDERLWKPLGMVDTGFELRSTDLSRYALALPKDPLTGQPQFVLHADSRKMKFPCGGGCAFSSAPDYLRFAQMLLDGGTFQGKRLLSRKTVEYMSSDHLGAAVRARTTSTVLPEGYGFGLGFAVRGQNGIAVISGSTGDFFWGGAYGTLFWVDPKEQMVVVYMAHATGALGAQYRAMIRNLVYQAIVD
jgi:CubicO group peptidase (beta-lactamase class C family)